MCFDQVLRVVLGFLFYPRRGRCEIGSIGRIIFHEFLKINWAEYGVNKSHLRAPPFFFFFGLFDIHERSWRFTGGLEHLRYTEYGYYNQTIRDQSRLRIPKDRQEGHIPGWDANMWNAWDLSVYGCFLSSTLLCSRDRQIVLGAHIMC